MADLVLKNIDQAVIRVLEQGAKRLGITLEAAAIRALSVPTSLAEQFDEREIDAFLMGQGDVDDTPKRSAAATVRSSSEDRGPEASSGQGERTLGERQAALAAAYPDEYVVLVGERIVVHTANREEAYSHHDAAFDEEGGIEPIVVAPGPLRRLGPPVVRGRALSGKGRTGR
jgi:hypothetical protein